MTALASAELLLVIDVEATTSAEGSLPKHEWRRSRSAQCWLTKRPGMAEALTYASLPLQGRHHRALDDARNIARLLERTLRRDPR